MNASFKRKLMTLSLLSVGFAFYMPHTVYATSFKSPKIKPFISDDSFKQYPKMGEIKADLNIALDLHKTASSLISEKEVLEKYKATIEKYNEIVRRLAQNESCNKTQLAENFSDADSIWEKVSAWAQDSAKTLMGEASDSFGSGAEDVSKGSMDVKEDISDDEVANLAFSKDASVSANMTEEELKNLAPVTSENDFEMGDLNMDDAKAFGKIRWDIGDAVLKDVYANPNQWGNTIKEFSPWVDQKNAYMEYIKARYVEYMMAYIQKNPDKIVQAVGKLSKIYSPAEFFSKGINPSAKPTDSFLPKDYVGSGSNKTIAFSPAFSYKLKEDEIWKQNGTCTEISGGRLYSEHTAYVNAINLAIKAMNEAIGDGLAPFPYVKIDLPCMPMAPLPPWRESVYILSVEDEIPQLSSQLPEPWEKVLKNLHYYTPTGELSNLVEQYKDTLRYRPQDYNAETGEIKNYSDGTPRLPLPLNVNRISSYLGLVAAEEEEKPNKDRAVAAIQEMNEEIIKTFSIAGYDIPNPSGFNLGDDDDYEMALSKLEELQKERINTITSKIRALRAKYGKNLLKSVTQMLEEEEATVDALEKDTEFLIEVSRDNAPEINSLLITAIADAVANQTYKASLEESMEDLTEVPAVGCPVL